MKIFVSWSGDLSRQIAEVLKKWIPCIIQSVEVFFSKEDIEKGDNWDNTISKELSECNYGIICLTPDNTTAPWINFEAGAIAKSLDSKVSALMINIKPSDIKGPLSRYQATKFEKEDFFQLILSINKALEVPLDSSVLQNAFSAMWTTLEGEANSIIENYSVINKNASNEQTENEPVEEILQLLRKQNTILSNPESILPLDYIDYMLRRFSEKNQESLVENEMFYGELIHYLEYTIESMYNFPENSTTLEFLKVIKFEELLHILLRNFRRKDNRRYYNYIRQIEKKYSNIIKDKMNITTDNNYIVKKTTISK